MPSGFLSWVLFVVKRERCSGSRWYFIASSSNSWHSVLSLIRLSDSTELIRKSRASRGNLTCRRSWGKKLNKKVIVDLQVGKLINWPWDHKKICGLETKMNPKSLQLIRDTQFKFSSLARELLYLVNPGICYTSCINFSISVPTALELLIIYSSFFLPWQCTALCLLYHALPNSTWIGTLSLLKQYSTDYWRWALQPAIKIGVSYEI